MQPSQQAAPKVTSPLPNLSRNFLHLAMDHNDSWACLTLHETVQRNRLISRPEPPELSTQGGHGVGAPQAGAGGFAARWEDTAEQGQRSQIPG